jgi:hypothetical protein
VVEDIFTGHNAVFHIAVSGMAGSMCSRRPAGSDNDG